MNKVWFSVLLILIIIIFGGLLSLSFLNPKDKGAEAIIPEPIVIEKIVYVDQPNKTQYIYTPFPESWEIADNLTLGEFPLSLEQTIKSSLDGAGFHLYWYKQGVDTDHNLYWWNVHKSAAYWLENWRD